MAYVSYKNLIKRTEPDQVLRDKAFKGGSNPRYDDYQIVLDSMIYKFLNTKTAGSSAKSIPNQQLAD